MIKKLQNREPFSFARYGDGEWAMIFRYNPTYNRTIKIYGIGSVVAGNELREIIMRPPQYIIGLQPLAMRMYGDEIRRMIKKEVQTTNADIFHKMSMNGLLDVFLQELEGRPVCLVGPEYLKDLQFEFDHVITPEFSAWDHVPRLEIEIIDWLRDKVEPVVLYSASMAAKILIDRLYTPYITQIDTGSVFDPYVGVNSRGYHQRVIERLKKA